MAAKSKDFLRIDINDSQVRKVVCVRQGDTIARTLCISIVNNGVPIDLSTCLVAEILIKKADGYEADNGCVLTSSEVQYTLRSTDIAAIGENKAQIMLTFKDGEVLTTPTFIISVYSQEMDPKVVASFNEYTSITQQVVLADQCATRAEEAAQAAIESETATRQLANDAIEAAENVKEVAGAAKESEFNAKEFATKAEESADNAEIAMTTILNNIDRAETAMTSAEEAALTATQAKNVVVDAKDAVIALEASAEASAQAALNAENEAKEAARDAATIAAAEVVDTLEDLVLQAEDARDKSEEYKEGSKQYYEQTKGIAEGFAGTLIPVGTVAFESLPSVDEAVVGWMYNISNEFVTTDDFKEGAGYAIPLGSNVYLTADRKWDILAGSPVTGIKGDKEASYRRGNVNITLSDIGAASKEEFDTHATNEDIHVTKAEKDKWNNIEVPIATASTAGLMKPDNVTIIVDADGTIHAAAKVGAYLTVETQTDTFEGLEVTATNNYETVRGTFSNGVASLVLGYLGEYTLSVTNVDTRVYTETVEVLALGSMISATINEHYTVINLTTSSEELKSADIIVDYRNGSDLIRFTNGSATYKAYEIGEYTFTCAYEGEDYATTVNVEELDTTYEAEIEKEYATVLISTSSNELANAKITVKRNDVFVKDIYFDGLSVTYLAHPAGLFTFCVTYEMEEYSTSVDVEMNQSYETSIDLIQLVPFATGTDEQITKMVNAYYEGKLSLDDIQSVWSVGDTRTLNLAASETSGIGNYQNITETHKAQSLELVILDFNHDDLTNPINGRTKALITLQQKDCMQLETNSQLMLENSVRDPSLGSMNTTNTNVGGWSSCERRVWCNNKYFDSLPSFVKSLIKPVNKLTSAGNKASTIITDSDKVFLLSEIEIFGTTTYSASGEGCQYKYMETASNRYKKPLWSDPDSNVSGCWWERSPYLSNATHFCSVNNSGSASFGNAYYTYGLAPAFCL